MKIKWRSCDDHAIVKGGSLEGLLRIALESFNADYNENKGEYAEASTGDTLIIVDRPEGCPIRIRDCKLRRIGTLETREETIARLKDELRQLEEGE